MRRKQQFNIIPHQWSLQSTCGEGKDDRTEANQDSISEQHILVQQNIDLCTIGKIHIHKFILGHKTSPLFFFF